MLGNQLSQKGEGLTCLKLLGEGLTCLLYIYHFLQVLVLCTNAGQIIAIQQLNYWDLNTRPSTLDTISEVIVHQLSQKLKLLGERPILLLYIYQLQLEVNILSTKFFFLILEVILP